MAPSAAPLIHAQKFELEEALQSVADDELIETVRPAVMPSSWLCRFLAPPRRGKARRGRTAGAAFRTEAGPRWMKRRLSGSDEHADERHDRHPESTMCTKDDDVGHHHVSSDAGGEAARSMYPAEVAIDCIALFSRS